MTRYELKCVRLLSMKQLAPTKKHSSYSIILMTELENSVKYYHSGGGDITLKSTIGVGTTITIIL